MTEKHVWILADLLGFWGFFFYESWWYRINVVCSTDPNEEDSSTFSYKDMIERDERRWKAADKDNDGFLSKEEFADFLHPEEAEHMRDIVVKVSSGQPLLRTYQ